MKRLKLILRGNFYRLIGKNPDLFCERYKICRSCPFNSKNNKELNWKQKLWALLGDYCVDCGCPLKSKLVEPLSECPQLKWGQKL